MFIIRPILNTSAEYANFHFPAPHEVTLFIIVDMSVGIVSGGILANIFVLYLSFFSPLVTGHFKYFMANLAFCDLCYNLSVCCAAFSQMYHDYMNVPYTPTTCYATIFFPFVFGVSILGFAMPLTAVNRYVVIVMQRDDWFTKGRVFLLCFCSYLPLICPLVDFLFAPYITNFYFNDVFTIYTPYIYEAFFFEVPLFGLPLLGFCSLRVYQKLSQHISVVSARLHKTPEEINIEKSILKAILIQALAPVICSLPLIFVLLMIGFYGWDSTAVKLPIFSYGENHEYHYTTIYLSCNIMAVFPSLDPYITLLIVKSYRRGADKFLARFKIYRIFTANGTVPQRDAAQRTATR